MPLGLVSDAEFEAALGRCERVTVSSASRRGRIGPETGPDSVAECDGDDSRVEKGRSGKGRTPGATAIPPILRDVMAEAAVAGGHTQQQVADAFGSSRSSVVSFVNGHRTATWDGELDPRLVKKVDGVREQIIGKARGTLLDALDEVTREKLKAARVRDVSAVAKDMSTIIANQEPKIIGEVKQEIGAQFVFHVPEVRKESEFDVIDVVGS